MAGMLAVLGLFVKFSSLPESETIESGEVDASILQCPQLILGAITLFFYVGVEVIAGDTIGLFGKGMGVSNFGQLTSYTMNFMVTGYIFSMIAIPRRVSFSAILGLMFSLLLLNANPESNALWVSLFGWTGAPVIPDEVLYVALFGLSNALVWSVIWPLALEGLSKKTSAGSALLIMGISGAAILPVVYGAYAEAFDNLQGAIGL